MKNIIQIAGVIDKDEAQMLIDCGVEYLGFPLRLAVHKEDISESDASLIIKSLKPPVYGVLITYLNNADEIKKFCEYLGTSIVQLHGDISLEELSKLKTIAPQIKVIKSLIVKGDNLNELKSIVKSISQYVDYFITDTYDPITSACGATGKTHDWNISKKLIEISSKPVILAGGLNPDNVRKAILEVKPAGVDSHTGVENKNGRKDKDLVKKFVSEAKEAFELL